MEMNLTKYAWQMCMDIIPPPFDDNCWNHCRTS